MSATTKETSRAAFRRHLNETCAGITHRNGRFAQKTRPYGDYLFAQDRAKFDVEYAVWLEAKEAELDAAFAAGATKLPRIVRFFGTVENDNCPHCGATGKYVHRFATDDGRHLGAMSGCVRLFPVSPVAQEHMRIAKKATDAAKFGRQLNRWDLAALEAIESFYAGTMSESDAIRRVQQEKSAASAWRQARYRR